MTQLLTEEEIQSCIEEGERSFRCYKGGVRGQMVTSQDNLEWHYIAAAERMIFAKLAKEEPVAWSVFDEEGMPEFWAAWPDACHEHINDAINEFDRVEATKFKVIPLYLHAPQAVPEGWKLVPIEPTSEMLSAAATAPIPAVYLDSISARSALQHKVVYKAMLAAAPSPEGDQP